MFNVHLLSISRSFLRTTGRSRVTIVSCFANLFGTFCRHLIKSSIVKPKLCEHRIFHEHLINQKQSIQFTTEHEKDNQLPFLDVNREVWTKIDDICIQEKNTYIFIHQFHITSSSKNTNGNKSKQSKNTSKLNFEYLTKVWLSKESSTKDH